jgi:hypothetical protein
LADIRTHHVPECYLRNFSNDKGQVVAYSRDEPSFLVDVSNICVRKGLYDDELEDTLARQETLVSPLLQKLIRENRSPVQTLEETERNVLSSFIGYMNSRNPYTLDELKRIHEVHSDLLFGFAATDSDNLNSYLAQVYRVTPHTDYNYHRG